MVATLFPTHSCQIDIAAVPDAPSGGGDDGRQGLRQARFAFGAVNMVERHGSAL